jgi:hypothetical protein
MADISALGTLNSAEPLDLDMYEASKESTFRLPAKGRYTVRAPESIPDTAFSATQANYLAAQVDPTIVGPTNEGFQLRFVKVSAKPFERSGKKVSMLGDYLNACGITGALDASPQAQADAVQSTAGRTYDVILDWRARNATTGLVVEGMENFPKLDDGTHQSWIADPKDIDPNTGEPKRVRANIQVRKFLPSA